MTRFFGLTIALALFAGGAVFAQEDYDPPFLTDDDITAWETDLEEDTADLAWIDEVIWEDDGEGDEVAEVAPYRLFHLLILDRTHSAPGSDILPTEGMEILYLFHHGQNGYLIAAFTSLQGGEMLLGMPDGSRIMVNLTTARRGTLTEFVNSAAFRRFVTHRQVTRDLLRALR